MRRSRGFTLIELMITIAILAIVAAIAWPSYQDQVMRTRRATAKAALTDVAGRLERCFTRHGAYNHADCVAASTTTSEGDWYSISTSALTATSYTLQAVPNATQAAADPKCGTLTLTHVGVRSQSGTPSAGYHCW